MPKGRLLAEKTLNARLGILGGISILGTTGIVRPMSHEAYEATIVSSLSVARAGGCGRVVLTTGRRSERFAQSAMPDLPEIAFIQIGDFFKISLEAAAQKGIAGITLAVLFGKAVKMAQGFAHTHAAKSDLSLAVLSEWAMEVTSDQGIQQAPGNGQHRPRSLVHDHGNPSGPDFGCRQAHDSLRPQVQRIACRSSGDDF